MIIIKTHNIIIELNDINKNYSSGDNKVRALNDITLHVEKGEIVMIMGPSGSGKTTLLQIIGALLKPTSGNVLIDGKNILDEKKKKAREIKT